MSCDKKPSVIVSSIPTFGILPGTQFGYEDKAWVIVLDSGAPVVAVKEWGDALVMVSQLNQVVTGEL